MSGGEVGLCPWELAVQRDWEEREMGERAEGKKGEGPRLVIRWLCACKHLACGFGRCLVMESV